MLVVTGDGSNSSNWEGGIQPQSGALLYPGPGDSVLGKGLWHQNCLSILWGCFQ